MTAAERKQLGSLLDEVRSAVEDLLLAGLTTASKATVERVDVTFKEASRLKLLRLGSNLRLVNEEVSRFTASSAQFSPRRLSFFLGRTWLLATAMRRALEAGDEALFGRLMWTPPSEPVATLKVVTLGVGKRVVSGAFAAFEFRLRAVEASGPVAAGEPLVWSSVFPMPKGRDLPAEAFLHLPQKQKFKPSVLLEGSVVEVTKCAVARQPGGGAARLMLGDACEVKAGAAFKGWEGLWTWDAAGARQRLAAHRPSPLDLEVELQEEVVLADWEAGKAEAGDEGYDVMPVSAGGLAFEARLDRGPSGNPLNAVMKKLAGARKNRPPLYGVAHYEGCRVMFQPLTALGPDGPEYLTVSKDKVSQAELVKAMKFT